MARPAVTLAMIVRDEDRNLADCLRPVVELFGEVVVVDTGSRDRTREVAAAFGAKVSDFPWNGSFADARNAALEQATGRWAFRLDADDRIDPRNVARLRNLLDGLPDALHAYAVEYRHDLGPGRPVVEHPEVRLFPNRPDIRWRYRAHEQIVPAVLEAGGVVVRTEVVVDHLGHRDPAARRRKLERNPALLLKDYAERPNDAYVTHYLGWTLLDLGRPAEAVGWLERACRDARPGEPLAARCHAHLSRAYAEAGRPKQALAACRAGRIRHASDAELVYIEGGLLLQAGDRAAAEDRFRFLLCGAAVADEMSMIPGLCGPLARCALASAFGPDRAAEQEVLWRSVTAERPDIVPAWLGLGELFAAQGRWAEVQWTLDAIDRMSPGGAAGAVVRARWLAAKGNFRAAAKLLRTVAARHPRDVLPRLALAQVLMLAGADRAAAEAALIDVLAMAPGHAEAGRLIRLIRQRWG